LRVYPGANGQFTLYDDDGISQEYLAGRGQWIRMAWNDQTRQLTLEPGGARGATNAGPAREFQVRLPDGTSKSVTYRGTRVVVAF
jgi:hypothetical protein